MSTDDFDTKNPDGQRPAFSQMESVDYLLFDSIVHHMIEKGLFTRNDALSIIQSVSTIVRGYAQDEHLAADASSALSLLERTYASYEAIPDRGNPSLEAENVHQLRPPVHGDIPGFPRDD
jgi:hypothetical protein